MPRKLNVLMTGKMISNLNKSPPPRQSIPQLLYNGHYAHNAANKSVPNSMSVRSKELLILLRFLAAKAAAQPAHPPTTITFGMFYPQDCLSCH